MSHQEMGSSPLSYVIPTLCALAHASFLIYRYDAFVTRGERVEDEPLWVVVLLPTLYLALVYVGTKVMSARTAAFEPTAAMFVYNIYETLLSLTMLVLLLGETVGKGLNPFDALIDRSPRGSILAYALWVNYQSKYVMQCLR